LLARNIIPEYFSFHPYMALPFFRVMPYKDEDDYRYYQDENSCGIASNISLLTGLFFKALKKFFGSFFLIFSTDAAPITLFNII
jgi:hypothetical protein